MHIPAVSIILTNYNGERFVMEAVHSVLDQTFEDWELIIVDDCSTDGSPALLKQLTDPRIRYCETARNSQVSAAHNLGNMKARGKYIACIDNDDKWMPEKLQIQVEYMESHPETGVCFSLPVIIDENGEIVKGTEYERLFYVENKSREEWLHEFLIAGNHIQNPSSLIRSEVLQAIGDNDLCLVQLHDYDLWVRIALSYEMYLIQKPLVMNRRFSGSGSLSERTNENSVRADFEFSWVIGTTVKNMEKDLFRKVFYREMLHPEAESEEEILCEKALLLAGDYLHENCRMFAFELFEAIFRNPETADLMREKYRFTQHDVYRMTGKPICIGTDIMRRQREKEKEMETLRNQLREKTEEMDRLYSLYQKTASDIGAMKESLSWRITKPLRSLGDKLRSSGLAGRK